MRRVTWFWRRRCRDRRHWLRHARSAAVDSVRPSNLAPNAGGAVRRAGGRVREAMAEGVTAARRRERELRAERDGDLVRLGDYLAPGDELLVDGETVEPARVIVMRHREHRRS